MRVNAAHFRERTTAGEWIDFVVFSAKSGTGANAQLLVSLTMKARASGLQVDQSALAYTERRKMMYYGPKTLVDYLTRNGVPRWTHEIEA